MEDKNNFALYNNELIEAYEKQIDTQNELINKLLDTMNKITETKEKESNMTLKIIVITIFISFIILIMFIIFCYFWGVKDKNYNKEIKDGRIEVICQQEIIQE